MSARIPSLSQVKPVETASSNTAAIAKSAVGSLGSLIFKKEEVTLINFSSVPEIREKIRGIGQKFINTFPQSQDFQKFYIYYQAYSMFWQKVLAEPDMSPEKNYTFLWHFMQEYSPYEHKFSGALLEQFLAQDDQHLFTKELSTLDHRLVRAFWASNWLDVTKLIATIQTLAPLSIYYKNVWLFAEIQLCIKKRENDSLDAILKLISQLEPFKAIEPTEMDLNLLTRMVHATLHSDSELTKAVELFHQQDVRTLRCAITLAAMSLMNGHRLQTIPKSILLYRYLLCDIHTHYLIPIQQQPLAPSLPDKSSFNDQKAASSSKQTEIVKKIL